MKKWQDKCNYFKKLLADTEMKLSDAFKEISDLRMDREPPPGAPKEETPKGKEKKESAKEKKETTEKEEPVSVLKHDVSKLSFRVPDQVGHNPTCMDKEDDQNLEIWV